MITHLHIEFLNQGALAMFEKPEGQMVWYLGDVTPTTEGTWEARQLGSRMYLNTTIDIALSELGGRLRTKLAELAELSGPGETGSLVFCLQAAYNLDRVVEEMVLLGPPITAITIDTSANASTDTRTDDTSNTGSITFSNTGSSGESTVISAAYPLDPMNPPRGQMRVQEPVGTWVLGGVAFIPGTEMGTELKEGDDAVTIIEQGCRAFMQAHEPGMHDAITAGAMRFHDPANPRHEFPMGSPMTEEAIAQAMVHRQAQKAKAQQVVAKARKLLMVCLTPYQRYEFLEYGEFHVAGLDGFTYVIREQFGHNVFRIEDGDQTWIYCLVTADWGVPKFDLMLAQKLLLEREPEAFFEKANAWRLML